MRKRNVHVQFWLDKKEAEALNKKVKRSGLSREVYLRHLINGLVPQDAPPPAYFDFMRELHGIGNNLNQIAQKAHVLGVIDERRYEEETRKPVSRLPSKQQKRLKKQPRPQPGPPELPPMLPALRRKRL